VGELVGQFTVDSERDRPDFVTAKEMSTAPVDRTRDRRLPPRWSSRRGPWRSRSRGVLTSRPRTCRLAGSPGGTRGRQSTEYPPGHLAADVELHADKGDAEGHAATNSPDYQARLALLNAAGTQTG
jgi:hypothetical protein